jgi:hypothetical protein
MSTRWHLGPAPKDGFMFRHVLIAALALPGIASAQSSFTEARGRPTDSFAISACGDAAAAEVRSRNPMAGNVHVADSRASTSSDTSTDVSGTGQFQNGSQPARSFTFRCSYDVRAGRTSGVSVSM